MYELNNWNHDFIVHSMSSADCILCRFQGRTPTSITAKWLCSPYVQQVRSVCSETIKKMKLPLAFAVNCLFKRCHSSSQMDIRSNNWNSIEPLPEAIFLYGSKLGHITKLSKGDHTARRRQKIESVSQAFARSRGTCHTATPA